MSCKRAEEGGGGEDHGPCRSSKGTLVPWLLPPSHSEPRPSSSSQQQRCCDGTEERDRTFALVNLWNFRDPAPFPPLPPAPAALCTVTAWTHADTHTHSRHVSGFGGSFFLLFLLFFKFWFMFVFYVCIHAFLSSWSCKKFSLNVCYTGTTTLIRDDQQSSEKPAIFQTYEAHAISGSQDVVCRLYFRYCISGVLTCTWTWTLST